MAITVAGVPTTNSTGLLDVGVRPSDQVQILTVNGVATTTLLQTTGGSPTPLLLGTHYDNLQVTEIISDSSFEFDAFLNGTALGLTAANLIITSGESFTYNIVHTYTTDEQVAMICAIAQSFASKRVLCVWPPSADWDDGNGGTVTLDGSALCAALAGAMSAYPAQQSFTNLAFPGPTKLHYSNGYFSPGQLKTLSAAGVFVLMQDADGAQIYSRHQVTTDMSNIKTQEFSVVKAVDQLAYQLYTLAKPYIGKYNITQNLLTMLNDLLDQELFAAQNNSSPMCGPLILSSKNLVLAAQLDNQNTNIPLGVLQISLTATVGYPANQIDMTINVE
jgi:hypothetical protein